MSKEIEVGEYVRTKTGQIHKIINIMPYYENNKLIYDEQLVELEHNFSGWKIWQLMSFVIKHSKDIIDLIEVGDYVNGRKVYQVGYNFQDDYVLKMSDSSYEDFIHSEDIVSIVTKEQFSSIEYKV